MSSDRSALACATPCGGLPHPMQSSMFLRNIAEWARPHPMITRVTRTKRWCKPHAWQAAIQWQLIPCNTHNRFFFVLAFATPIHAMIGGKHGRVVHGQALRVTRLRPPAVAPVPDCSCPSPGLQVATVATCTVQVAAACTSYANRG